jgi:hypothetical protein
VLFTEDAIDRAELTEEHVIPKKLGGTLVTLTCKRCNSTHGAELDAELIQMVRCHDSLQGVGSTRFKGHLEVAGIRVPTDVDWNLAVPAESTNFLLRRFNPAIHAQLREALKSGTVDTVKVHMSFGYNEARANLAALRIAYLASFREAGYRYILTPAVQRIRQLIERFDDSPPPDIGPIFGEMEDITPAPIEPLAFYDISDVAVMVVMTLVAETKRRRYCMFMPTPHTPADRVLETLAEEARGWGERLALRTAR